MGLYADAELIWGIPVTEEDNPELWDPHRYGDDDGDWREDIEDDSELKIETFGHYEDPDTRRAILSSTRIDSFRGDCWSPERVSAPDIEVYLPKAISKANDRLRLLGLDGLDFSDAGWYLVASYG